MSKSNRLIHEKSPYLLQHAHNPVDWFPWGEEAFAKAKNEDKLIFLSIGYATCHWCHVMERESFEDPKTAEIINQNFIPVKLDREERPDVDKIYMDAIHAIGQQGGWPLNIFLTPDLKPLTGGTYFPPVRRHGMKSFPEVLEMVRSFWIEKKQEMLLAAEDLSRHIELRVDPSQSLSLLSKDCFTTAFTLFEYYFDTEYFGFKTNQQNKFPPSMGLSFLLAYHHWTKEPMALEIAEKTLQAMKRGGIYDQIGGGLCRYSTDHQWLVPHFEKMLYDNSLFIISLVEAWQVTKNNFYKEAAVDTIHYIEKDLRTKEGGVSCAEDADSEGEEGKFYIFSYQELESILEKDEIKFAKEFWNVEKNGNFEGNNILHESIRIDPEIVKSHLNTDANFDKRLQSIRSKIANYRNKRIRPLLDDKVLTSWNALYIQALAIAGSAFGNKEFIDLAENSYAFLESKLLIPNVGLLRRYREGESKYLGNLVDYAGLGVAALELHKTTQNRKYFHIAMKMSEWIIEKFSSPTGAYYETEEKATDLIRRSIDGYDGVEPSGNSMTAKLLIELANLGFQTDDYEKRAEGIFQYFHKELSTQGISFPYMLRAYLEYRELSGEILIVESSLGYQKDSQEIKDTIHSSFLPGKIILYSNSETFSEDSKLFSALEGRSPVEKTSVYFCKNRVCKLPVTTLADVKKLCISPESF
jgi:uncharacterized protein YyaL (SSP411 family)